MSLFFQSKKIKKGKFWESPYNVLKKVILVALQTCKHENSHIPLDDFEFDAKEVIY